MFSGLVVLWFFSACNDGQGTPQQGTQLVECVTRGKRTLAVGRGPDLDVFLSGVVGEDPVNGPCTCGIGDGVKPVVVVRTCVWTRMQATRSASKTPVSLQLVALRELVFLEGKAIRDRNTNDGAAGYQVRQLF